MTIPLVDLAIQHREIETEVREGIDAVMRTGAFVLGPAVTEFESAYADYCEVSHCIGVASGTDALELGLRALDIGPGDEVVVPANTFIASAMAVVRAGARPVLVDCDAEHLLIDVAQTSERIGSRTRAIMAVDLFGQAAPLEQIEDLAREAGVARVAVPPQAHGAGPRGRAAGPFGDVPGTSFYPGKNLGAYGDAGAVLTRSADIADRVRRLRNYGSEIKYHHPVQGWNSRLDTVQAVVLLAKLRRLAAWNEQRRKAAERYDERLAELPGVRRPTTRHDNEHVWHIYAIRVSDRDRVLAALNEAGIGAGIHYPTPIHLQGAFADLGHGKGDFPNAEQAAAEMISLPLYPGISAAQQEEVVAALVAALSATRG
jgi:dTDP-4-amino-4,6-dideoxygalactose transaminase